MNGRIGIRSSLVLLFLPAPFLVRLYPALASVLEPFGGM